jgi:NhaC family Na+:H+ antiporter
MDAIANRCSTDNETLTDLFTSGGMQKILLGTIWLIICAMVFGGIMDTYRRFSVTLLKL